MVILYIVYVHIHIRYIQKSNNVITYIHDTN